MYILSVLGLKASQFVILRFPAITIFILLVFSNVEYTLSEHKHRFAIWTAARAVQRSWTTTANISRVITAVQLQALVESYKNLKSQAEFDEIHKRLCEKMIDEFRLLGVESTYGRAAKILAVYLKTSIIMAADVDNEQMRFIHPPIDRILLRNLPVNIDFGEVKKLNWTQLNKDKYWSMVQTLRELLGILDWRLEMVWRPELEKV